MKLCAYDDPSETPGRASAFYAAMFPLIMSLGGPAEIRRYCARMDEIVLHLDERFVQLLPLGHPKVLSCVGRAKYLGAQLLILRGCVAATALGSQVALVIGLQAMSYIDAELKGITFALDEVKDSLPTSHRLPRS